VRIKAMKLIILGTSAAFAGKDDGCPSYLLICNGKNYLIETGPGCMSTLQKYISYRELSGIFLSHLHADHVSELYTLRYAVYIAQRDGLMKKQLPIYMPKSPRQAFKFIRATIKNEFDIHEISEELKLNLDGLSISFLKTNHPVSAYAMRFEHGLKTLVYTSDSAYFDALGHFCKDASLLLSEATLQNTDRQFEQQGHMTAETAGRLARESGARKLVLTHIWPEYDKNVSLREARTTFNGEIVIAKRGQMFSI